jgi:hypothetical protein
MGWKDGSFASSFSSAADSILLVGPLTGGMVGSIVDDILKLFGVNITPTDLSSSIYNAFANTFTGDSVFSKAVQDSLKNSRNAGQNPFIALVKALFVGVGNVFSSFISGIGNWFDTFDPIELIKEKTSDTWIGKKIFGDKETEKAQVKNSITNPVIPPDIGKPIVETESVISQGPPKIQKTTAEKVIELEKQIVINTDKRRQMSADYEGEDKGEKLGALNQQYRDLKSELDNLKSIQVKMQSGGVAWKVPGNQNIHGDNYPTLLQEGSVVINKAAVKAYNLQKGGIVPALLEPGEVVVPPKSKEIVSKALSINKSVPRSTMPGFKRYQTGGVISDEYMVDTPPNTSSDPIATSALNKIKTEEEKLKTTKPDHPITQTINKMEEESKTESSKPKWPEKASKYRPILEEASRKHKIPIDLLAAQIETESSWDPTAVSPAGAKGLAQFMPGTAKDYGIAGEEFIPEKSINAQAKYMEKLLSLFNGNIEKALAAYNWGPGNVQRKGISNLPEETSNYIQRINTNRIKYASSSDLYSSISTPTDSSDVSSSFSTSISDMDVKGSLSTVGGYLQKTLNFAFHSLGKLIGQMITGNLFSGSETEDKKDTDITDSWLTKAKDIASFGTSKVSGETLSGGKWDRKSSAPLPKWEGTTPVIRVVNAMEPYKGEGTPFRIGAGGPGRPVRFPGYKFDDVSYSGQASGKIVEPVWHNFNQMAIEYYNQTGKKIQLNSAYRTYEDQVSMKKDKGAIAAKPGSSPHQYGVGLDINTVDANALKQTNMLRGFGFSTPYFKQGEDTIGQGAEAWHIQPIGSKGKINLFTNAKADIPKDAQKEKEDSPGFFSNLYSKTSDYVSDNYAKVKEKVTKPKDETLNVQSGGIVHLQSGGMVSSDASKISDKFGMTDAVVNAKFKEEMEKAGYPNANIHWTDVDLFYKGGRRYRGLSFDLYDPEEEAKYDKAYANAKAEAEKLRKPKAKPKTDKSSKPKTEIEKAINTIPKSDEDVSSKTSSKVSQNVPNIESVSEKASGMMSDAISKVSQNVPNIESVSGKASGFLGNISNKVSSSIKSIPSISDVSSKASGMMSDAISKAPSMLKNNLPIDAEKIKSVVESAKVSLPRNINPINPIQPTVAKLQDVQTKEIETEMRREEEAMQTKQTSSPPTNAERTEASMQPLANKSAAVEGGSKSASRTTASRSSELDVIPEGLASLLASAAEKFVATAV